MTYSVSHRWWRIAAVPFVAVALAVVTAIAQATPALAATWAVVTTPNTAGEDNRFNGVDARSGSDAWAVGSSRAAWNTPTAALVARWNGSAWSLVSTPAVSGAALNGVDGSGATNVWAVGAAGSAPLIERWNGTAWSVVASGAPAGSTGARLRGVKVLSASDAWAVGDYSMSTNPGARTFILRWNGSAWTHVASPNPDSLQNLLVAVDGLAANDLWALGNMGNDGYGGDTVAGLMLRWNGSTWTQVALPSGGGFPSGFSTRKLHDLAVVASNDVWAVGTAFSFSSFSFVPYYVHWNGQNWVEGTLPNPGMGAFRTVNALSATKVYAFGSEGSQGLVARWNGSAWSRETPPTNGSLVDAAPVSPSTIWAVGWTLNASNNGRTLAVRTTNG
jgi:hypothetical protein